MANMSFGTILREARELKGYDLPSAARRLRIRVDILRAIEEEDFSRMPPRGYARSMVNAYARLVGLNPSEITKMYLDEAYAYQVGRARNSAAPTRNDQFDMGPSSRRGAVHGLHRGSRDSDGEPMGIFERTMFDDRRDYLKDELPDSFRGERRNSRDRTHPSRHSVLPNRPTTNLYAGPRSSSPLGGKLPFFIALGIFIVLLIVVLFLLFGNKSTPPEEAPKVPITGVSDTTGDTQDTPVEQKVTIQPPTSVKVTYKVSPGKEAYLAITQDGQSRDVACTGGETDTFDVTGDFTLATYRPDDVEVTVDGKKVEFTQASGQMPEVNVSFLEYLKQWEAEHPDAPKTSTSLESNAGGSSTMGASAGSTSAGSTAGSSSSAATTGSGTTSTSSAGSTGASGANSSGRN